MMPSLVPGETVYLHSPCLTELEVQVVARWEDGTPQEWITWCPKCEEQVGWGMDGGTVDLGLLPPRNEDFEIFP